jgi:hypothetical protein
MLGANNAVGLKPRFDGLLATPEGNELAQKPRLGYHPMASVHATAKRGNMKPAFEEVGRILELLAQGPLRIEAATRGFQPTRLYLRSDVEPWSVSDILAHLRACSDVWGNSIIAMVSQDNPTLRYVSPRSWMRKPEYQEQAFDAALESFAQERQKLVEMLADLDEAGWARRATFTRTSPRQRDQTVLSYSERIVNHEQPHLDQIESLLR